MQQWTSAYLRGERPGLKTPAVQRKTKGGCELRFRPRNTPEGKTFEDLEEGRPTQHILTQISSFQFSSTHF